MKANYVKPLVFFESFMLSQTIAFNCGDTHDSTLGESNHYNALSCEWVIGEGDEAEIIFVQSHCADWEMYDLETEEDLEGFEINGVCYNNPDGGQTIFSST